MAQRIIDMSKLPPLQLVRQVNYEDVLAEMKASFIKRCPDAALALRYESDPLVKWLEDQAYREMLLRQQQNEDALAVMLAYAKGADLDQIGAIYQVELLVIKAADKTTTPPTPAVMEGDEAFRKRIQMAPQGFSVAGPSGAYMFHTLSADGRVLDTTATSPTPGVVVITVLSTEGNGEASSELLQIVDKALNDIDVRPLTDEVRVQSAQIVPYQVKATIFTDAGPDTDVVMEAVKNSIQTYVSEQRKIGLKVPLSGIYSALHLSGVERVELLAPAADVAMGDYEAAYCDSVTLTKASSKTPPLPPEGENGSGSGE